MSTELDNVTLVPDSLDGLNVEQYNFGVYEAVDKLRKQNPNFKLINLIEEKFSDADPSQVDKNLRESLLMIHMDELQVKYFTRNNAVNPLVMPLGKQEKYVSEVAEVLKALKNDKAMQQGIAQQLNTNRAILDPKLKEKIDSMIVEQCPESKLAQNILKEKEERSFWQNTVLGKMEIFKDNDLFSAIANGLRGTVLGDKLKLQEKPKSP